MNIVGENFPRKIVDQINLRQQKKGAKNRTSTNLVWQNANTGWVKMISSVDINKEQRTKVSNAEMAETILPGDKLAKQYVLFGGVYEQGKGKEGLRGGIERNKSVLNDSAYGLGGLELGLRPMPGITSFSIKTENRGSLKTATIGIKCYNRHQFDIINTLYLSLGFSVLIEWGNTMYYEDEKTFIKDNPFSLADEFLEGKYKWDAILPKIQENRIKSCGNYDAALGKVVNFRWSINRDLTYDITLTVRTIGDVIESLKMNALSGYISTNLGMASSTYTVGAITQNINLENKAPLIKEMYNYLVNNLGLSSPQALGVLANIGRESFFTPSQEELGGGPGVGLFQYTYKARKDKFIKTVPDWKTNWQGQLQYAFNVDEQGISFKSKSFTSAEMAALDFLRNFETPWSNKEEQARIEPIRQQENLNQLAAVRKIIEPFNLNNLPPSAQPTQQTPAPVPLNNGITNSPTETSTVVIKKYAYTHDIGVLFNNLMVELDDDVNGWKTIGDDTVAIKIDFKNNARYYIRFGYFLQLLEEQIMYKLKDTDQKIIKFDYDTDSNLILLYDRQISADPTICIFQRKFILSNNEEIELFGLLNPFILEGSGNTYDSYYGKLMNVYFDMTFILTQLDILRDNNGTVTLIDLLKSLTQGFCNATGNFNKITPTVDENTNKIVFIDDIPLPDRDKLLQKYSPSSLEASNTPANFKMYGYYATANQNISEAGIVRDLSFSTTVSPNLASMITIGAQANGYVTGQDSTALSTMNLGLVDRVKNEWIEPNNPNQYPSPTSVPILVTPLPPTPPSTPSFLSPFQTPTNQQPQPVLTLNQKYKDTIQQFNRFIQDLDKQIWNQEDINAFSNSISSFAEYNQAEKTLKQRQTDSLLSSPSIGFLPFDITLTIDGLSGMKVYQKYITDTDFLPSNYPQSLEFLIKGITHEIKDNQWITTLESIAVPKNPFGKKEDFNLGSPVTGQPGLTERAPGAGGARPTNFTVNANYPNVRFQNIGLGNPSSDRINDNLLKDISTAAKQVGVTVSITTAVSGHKPGTRHASGNAVDVAIIDGIAVNPRASNRSKIDAFVAALQSLGYVKNTESGQAKAVLTFGFPNHNNHIHISNKV